VEDGTPSYDEEITPDIDPPQIEPPPPATLLGRIFTHRRQERMVVRAPLVRVDIPREPDEPPPAPSVEPAEPVAVEPLAAEPEPVEPEPEPEPEPVAVAEPVREPAPVQPSVTEVTRYCPGCRNRVAIAADGLHCARGHRLSPAHARRRGWFRGRRSH
jgi:hypothetical protein